MYLSAGPAILYMIGAQVEMKMLTWNSWADPYAHLLCLSNPPKSHYSDTTITAVVTTYSHITYSPMYMYATKQNATSNE